jgi:hypothetical protein
VNGVLEVRTRRGWERVFPNLDPPRILETDEIAIRGLAPEQRIVVGLTEVASDAAGCVTLRPATDEHLKGHVGLVEIAAAGVVAGELDIVPDKLSEPAYLELRAELQRVWTDLVLDPEGRTTVRAIPPSAHELWRRIDEPISRIVDHPNELLRVGTEVRRMEQARRPRELQPGVVRAGLRGRPALTRTLQRTTDTPENHLCRATLELLRSHARRDAGAGDVVRRIDRVLTHPVFRRSHSPVRTVTLGMRSDRRYRQVLAVHQILNRPELAATEGPGELRLGVPALSRLYEYWVFLQVLLAATERYGAPLDAGFDALAVRLPGSRRRLGLAHGTTVTFPGPVHVAFEPDIDARGDGWMGLEYVPHPDPARQQFAATPDVVVFRPGPDPWLTVVDAKYVGRPFVEMEAARVHEKYARMRWHGTPVVRDVLVAQPHEGYESRWAGYGYVPMRPGLPVRLPLPPAVSPNVPHVAAPAAAVAAGAVSIVADQYWMHGWLQGRRIEIGAMRDAVAAGRMVERCEIVMPRLAQLVSFARVAEQRGWQTHWLDSANRGKQVAAILELVSLRAGEGPVIVVSGDPAVTERLPAGRVEVFDDLERVPLIVSPTIL